MRLCAIFVSFPALAAAPETDALQQFVETVQTLSASFQQVQKDENGRVLQASSGRLWLSRPGRFRWSYEKPYEQLMVCDGKQLWQYDPDLKQAMVRPAGATLQGTPAQLLTDRAALAQHFTVEGAGTEEGAQRLRLLPKAPDSDFKSVELWLKDGVPVRMRFHDPLGGVSEVTFSDIGTNTHLDAGLFSFTPPKGTEVISAQ
ncbi:MAG: outer membrane lipoprotein chaperone LolA [Nevskiaceae bacterium]